ncbi:MAG: KamA family radical SAM protein [Candidatus Edwardsbacteria bacterium]|nr:KamA family radical SAM protein [Candidatus Edwardsbacteria bacterium]MBU1576983.1 KamA family radical SAM protein [Candidatus Edwardsbacteria bacterium]MBU2462708.1 KamA family radical SAM protein [Candidatus Edwardsbacteria bacterium]MBU2595193.1 KamA family radical SAM protein [Candidatus Edwardsbacteria bacterium]
MNYKKENIQRLFEANPTIHGILKEAENYLIAKNLLVVYLDEMVRMLHLDVIAPKSLEWSLQISCIYALRKLISARSENLAKFSIMKLLWQLTRDDSKDLPENLSDAFLEDLRHIFMGTTGKSRVYDQEIYSTSANMHGRESAVQRSDQLDAVALRCEGFIKRYASGLEPDVKKARQQNRDRILKKLNASLDDWNDHRWQMKNIVRNAEQLSSLIDLSDEEKKSIDKAKSGALPFGITPFYVSLMDQDPSRKNDHAVRAQVIPPANYVKKMLKNKEDHTHSLDFMLENDTSPIDLITRRYPRIVILKPYNTCSQICVYCQRNWEIEDVLCPEAMADPDKLEQAIGWIADHPMINEVLITGGDPLVMEDQQIDDVLLNLSRIDHVERIRIGSRTLVVLPQRITDNLIDIIAKYHQPGKREVAIVTHFEHPYEITEDSLKVVQKFKQKGMSVYNQAVFTVENSRRFELVALRRALRLIGVDPYYTFNTKGKEETRNYRVPLARLQQEVKEEARLFPGLVRTDEPVYNVPRLGKNYVRAEQHHTLLTIMPDGSRIYEFHPWEKKLALVDTYIDSDVPIYDYLQELKRRGENIEDYRTIYYYF